MSDPTFLPIEANTIASMRVMDLMKMEEEESPNVLEHISLVFLMLTICSILRHINCFKWCFRMDVSGLVWHILFTHVYG